MARLRNRPAAFLLVALTPLIAELALGSTPVRLAWLVLLWMPIYGAGVLLIRELVARTGRGWPAVLLLAVGYELLEDGVGLQALTSPHLYHAADWGLRVLGLNLPYWEANLVYHAVFTVMIPIALLNLLFPAHAGRPYLGIPGTIVAGAVAALGVVVLRVTVGLSEDPGYEAPLAFVAGCLLAVVVLAIVALVVVPRARPARDDARVPAPWLLAAGGALATLLFFALSFPVFGATQPAFTRGDQVVIPMLLTAALAVVVAWALRRWSNSVHWTSRHQLWLIGGALVAHSLGGLVVMAHTTVDRVGLIVIALLTVGAIALMDARLRSVPRVRAAG